MKNKLISIFYAFMASVIFTTSALAGGSIKLSSVTFELGSLHSRGYASGLGNTDWLMELGASGEAVVTCINVGSNDVPGQSYPHVEASGTVGLPADSQLRKNGKSPFNVTAEVIDPSWEEAGCPNANWTARTDFVYWEDATLSVIDPVTNITVATYQYDCTTTRTPQNDGYTLDDGTVLCKLIE